MDVDATTQYFLSYLTSTFYLLRVDSFTHLHLHSLVGLYVTYLYLLCPVSYIGLFASSLSYVFAGPGSRARTGIGLCFKTLYCVM